MENNAPSYLNNIRYGFTPHFRSDLNKLLNDPDTTTEKIAAFIQKNRNFLSYHSLTISGIPNERHYQLLNLCPQITAVHVHWEDSSPANFIPTITLIKCFPQITKIGLPTRGKCDHFAYLTQITDLNIYFNHISNEACMVLSKLPNLTALGWHWINSASSRHPGFLTILSQPEKVKQLGLSYNRDLCSREVLNKFSNLEILDLTCTESPLLKDETLQKFALPMLHTLNLSSNAQLTDAGIWHVKKFTNLTNLSLNLCENVGDEAIQVLLQNIQGFKDLSLHACPKITEIGLSYLQSQVKLKALSFGGGPIHNISFMQSLTRLRTLYIEKTLLDEAPESLPMLTHLKKLKLLTIHDASLINDTAIETLRHMTHLITFQISKSSITSQGQVIVDKLNVENVIWIS